MLTEVFKIVNDTLFTEVYIDENYAYTSRNFWETKTRKHDQIVKPTLSEVINIYVYNNHGDEVDVEKYEKGELIQKIMTTNYMYDTNDRIILKEVYYGEVLGSTEITIYE